MRGKSHYRLGEYLAERYMGHIPRHCVRAFLIGCVEPDRNPVTYIKGSFRHQWMRGHNYHNAKRFLSRLSRRLEQKMQLSILDYYALGKLIHYTADAFTLAHNRFFPRDLSCHRRYEAQLQEYFLQYLQENPTVDLRPDMEIMEAVRLCHREYSVQPPHIHTDAAYILRACCYTMSILFTDRSGVLP